ncbi:hypothetical protein KB559_15170 [Paenibacillus sp. Marseille-P2973]|uniref:hypothetical protein n=1 Tax=Paenibacillus sp. Marseille-P2973 TaxID=1871032 RepID=UPI001B39CA4E|nr:hypothetical protein [Paenibacillus sp. Marseille-P2973]MBQ4900174.1 hypothetical protein [Paenibacillus sp. Marseille-P2973]
MRAFAKAILISMLVTVAIMLFTNFIYFFPWYTTLIVETFNVTQVVASDNYLKEEYKDDVLEKLKDRPIYRKKADQIEISVKKRDSDTDDHSAEGRDASFYEELSEEEKPYRQRGESVTVKISAVYPLSIKLWGKELEREIPVSFTLKTTGLKHYKDLPYYEYLDGYEEP